MKLKPKLLKALTDLKPLQKHVGYTLQKKKGNKIRWTFDQKIVGKNANAILSKTISKGADIKKDKIIR